VSSTEIAEVTKDQYAQVEDPFGCGEALQEDCGHSKMRHILTSKSNTTKSRLGKSGLISDADHYNVSRMLPYA